MPLFGLLRHTVQPAEFVGVFTAVERCACAFEGAEDVVGKIVFRKIGFMVGDTATLRLEVAGLSREAVGGGLDCFVGRGGVGGGSSGGGRGEDAVCDERFAEGGQPCGEVA